MTLAVNGKAEFLRRKMTVLEFLIFKELNPNKLVIEHNEIILKREYWDKTTLKDNDTLEIISFVGGG